MASLTIPADPTMLIETVFWFSRIVWNQYLARYTHAQTQSLLCVR